MIRKDGIVMIDIELGWRNKLVRFFWGIFWYCLIKPSPVLLHSYRRFVYRMWGATISAGAHIYPDVRVWLPSNLTVGVGACLGPGVEVYNVAKVVLCERALVSQRTYICTASHDYERTGFPLIGAEVIIEKGAWISAECFIGPGLRIGANSVIYARSVVVKTVLDGQVMAGNPAKLLKMRT